MSDISTRTATQRGPFFSSFKSTCMPSTDRDLARQILSQHFPTTCCPHLVSLRLDDRADFAINRRLRGLRFPLDESWVPSRFQSITSTSPKSHLFSVTRKVRERGSRRTSQWPVSRCRGSIFDVRAFFHGEIPWPLASPKQKLLPSGDQHPVPVPFPARCPGSARVARPGRVKYTTTLSQRFINLRRKSSFFAASCAVLSTFTSSGLDVVPSAHKSHPSGHQLRDFASTQV